MAGGKGSAGLSFSLGLISALLLAMRGRSGLLGAAAAAAVIGALAVALLPLRGVRIRWAAVLLLAAALGGAAGLSRAPGWRLGAGGGAASAAAALRGVTRFEGVLEEDSQPGPEGDTRYVLRLRQVSREAEGVRTPAQGRVLLWAREGPRAWRGQSLAVRGTLRPWQALPGGAPPPFDFTGRARRGGVVPAGFAAGGLAVRARAVQALEVRTARIGEPAAALFRAFFLGRRQGIAEELQLSFTRSGSVHLLAISGQHLGILALLAGGCLFWLPSRRWRLVAAAFLAAGYFLLIGPLPSLSRAVLMLLAGTLAVLLDRDPQPLNLLGLSALVLLLADPAALSTLSFQLSYLALLGILVAGERLARGLSRWLPPVLCPPLAASLAANLATTPALLAAFGAAYPVGALAALPLVPLVTVFMAGGLLCLLPPAPVWEALAGLARPAMRLLYGAISRLLGLFAGAPALAADPAAGLPLAWLLPPLLVLIGLELPGRWRRFPRRRDGVPEAPVRRGAGETGSGTQAGEAPGAPGRLAA